MSGWPRQVLGPLANGRTADRPARLGGWELTLGRDWCVTATHPGRRQRVTVRLDGSLALQPLRP